MTSREQRSKEIRELEALIDWELAEEREIIDDLWEAICDG